jgi:hypothetical protein
VAANGPSVAEPLPGWAQYGLLGLIVIAWLTGQVVRGKLYDQAIEDRNAERKRTDDAEAASKTLMMEKVFPALTAYQLALQNTNDVILPALDRLVDRLDALEREAASEHRRGG